MDAEKTKPPTNFMESFINFNEMQEKLRLEAYKRLYLKEQTHKRKLQVFQKESSQSIKTKDDLTKSKPKPLTDLLNLNHKMKTVTEKLPITNPLVSKLQTNQDKIIQNRSQKMKQKQEMIRVQNVNKDNLDPKSVEKSIDQHQIKRLKMNQDEILKNGLEQEPKMFQIQDAQMYIMEEKRRKKSGSPRNQITFVRENYSDAPFTSYHNSTLNDLNSYQCDLSSSISKNETFEIGNILDVVQIKDKIKEKYEEGPKLVELTKEDLLPVNNEEMADLFDSEITSSETDQDQIELDLFLNSVESHLRILSTEKRRAFQSTVMNLLSRF